MHALLLINVTFHPYSMAFSFLFQMMAMAMIIVVLVIFIKQPVVNMDSLVFASIKTNHCKGINNCKVVVLVYRSK